MPVVFQAKLMILRRILTKNIDEQLKFVNLADAKSTWCFIIDLEVIHCNRLWCNRNFVLSDYFSAVIKRVQKEKSISCFCFLELDRTCFVLLLRGPEKGS